MGVIQRAFVGAAMAFIKTANPNFQYSLSGSIDGTEKPFMAFPVMEAMNRVVATPPGETPPTLGHEILEDAKAISRRKKRPASYDWKLEYVYTFSMWSAYVDFSDWRCMNLPGIRPFDLQNVIGRQPIVVTLYEIVSNANNKDNKHLKDDKIQVAQVELSNANASGLGPMAKQWYKKNRDSSVGEDDDMKILAGNNSYALMGSMDESTEVAADQAAEEQDVAELGEGTFRLDTVLSCSCYTSGN
jgi:hypothetical protein